MKRQLQYQQIFEATSDPIMLLTRQGFFDCNRATLELFKIADSEQFDRLAPWDLSPARQPDGADSKKAALGYISEAFEQGSITFYWIHKDMEGHEFPAEVTLSTFKVDDKPIVQAIVRDITQRKQVEEQLLQTNRILTERNLQLETIERQLRTEVEEKERAEFFLKTIINAVADPIFVKDRQHRWIEFNQAFCKFMGYSRETLLGKSDYQFFPEEEAEVFWEKDDLVFETGEENLNEEYFTDAQGKRHIISTKKACFTLPGSSEKLLVGVIRDITAQKQAEKELEQEKNYSENIIRNFLDTLIVTDIEGRIEKINEATLKLLDYQERELIGKPIETIFSNADRVTVRQFFTGDYQPFQINGNVRNLELQYRRRDGELISMSFNGSLLLDEHGDVSGVVAGAKDISGLKDAQKELKKQLREKETLLKEVHHRVKNNLFTMVSFLEMQLVSSDSTETKNLLEEAVNRLQTMALVHKHIYAREELSNISFSTFLKELVTEVVSTLKNSELSLNYHFDIEETHLSLDRMIPCGLIVNELLTNSVRHGFAGSDQGELIVSFKLKDGFYQLIVADNGRGLGSDFSLDNIAPSSLGLNLVKTMVRRQLKGELSYSSGDMTRFEISFPVEPA